MNGYYVAVFKSKTEVLSFVDKMRYYGADCTVVPIPKEAHQGCGISAKFLSRNAIIAKRLIDSGEFPSFYPVFEIIKLAGRTSTRRIY